MELVIWYEISKINLNSISIEPGDLTPPERKTSQNYTSYLRSSIYGNTKE